MELGSETSKNLKKDLGNLLQSIEECYIKRTKNFAEKAKFNSEIYKTLKGKIL